VTQDTVQLKERKQSVGIKRARRFALALLFCLLAISGAAISVFVLGRASYEWRGFEVELMVVPSSVGDTRLRLPPLGDVTARTHKAPISLVASLQNIQVEEIQKFLKKPPKPQEIEKEARQTARTVMLSFTARQLILSALGALIAPLLLRSRGRFWFVAMGVGAATTGVLLWGIASGFNGNAFQNPTYTGALKQAPWVIQFGRDAFSKFEVLSQKLKTVAGNLNTLYGRITAVSDKIKFDDPGGETFRVLHVSDIHNNPAAIGFLREVADQFKVSLIVDTGDLTDFGSPPEINLVKEIGKLPFPYVFVAGNHDSRTVMDALAKFPNVTILNGQRVEVGGLVFVGLANPASARPGVGSVDVTPEELQQGAEELARLVTAQAEPPDVVAVHDPKEARLIHGRVPLIVCGHMHKEGLETFAPVPAAPDAASGPALRTIICNAGTTGAAGGRYFEGKSGVPFSCAVLTFRRAKGTTADTTQSESTTENTETIQNSNASMTQRPNAQRPTLLRSRPTLRAVDLIVLDGTLNQYSIRHTDINGAPP
jgi:predicted phosphodiesterase